MKKIVLFFVMIILITGCKKSNDVNSDVISDYSYSIEEIRGKILDESYNDVYISDINLDDYNKLLLYIDKLVGKDNYYIKSVNYVYSESDSQKMDSIGMSIVLNKYVENFRSWRGYDYENPYTISFNYDLKNHKYEDYYYTFLSGKQYEKELIKDLSSKNGNYKYLVYNNEILNISSQNANANSKTTWKDVLKQINTEDFNVILYVISNNSSTIDELKNFVKTNKNIFKKYYINYVTVITLKENEEIENKVYSFSDSAIDSMYTLNLSYE